MIEIQVIEPIVLPVDPGLLENAARLSLEHQQADPQAGMTIVIGDDALLQQYNLQYLGIDEPTDVLSFPAGYPDPETDMLYLGDMLISLQRAGEQAQRGGHAIRDELLLLVVHGTLHLLGYDHAGDEEKARMQAAQDELLALLGCQISPRLD